MAKPSWQKIGLGVFFISWPVLWLYIRMSGTRSRVVIICNDEVLLVKNWMGEDKYALPGGGCKRGEPLKKAAKREVFEETGIVLHESSLKDLGLRNEKHLGLHHKSQFYSAKLPKKPILKRQRLEISELRWVPLQQLHTLRLQGDAADAISRYKPAKQANLL